ncbi:hypothetical protein BT246_16070 [Bacillus thuringiensis]|uniref:Uncharacterized protein n=1 Tax=Bacillus thuringiensis TaxID=1428 RepID=A0A9W3WZG8_BACTU|nr:hypothetical protein BT246_16070 [Bacillus thuringiensis]
MYAIKKKYYGEKTIDKGHFITGYEQLMGNYYPNRFQELEYKFTNEEIREEKDESFLYQAVAYVAGTENGKRSEMKLNYEVKIVKVNNIFMVLEQKQRVQ